MHRTIAISAVVGLLLALALPSPTWAQAYPAPGVVKLGSGPLPLLIHYLDKSGKQAQVQLRDMKFEPPPLAKSNELRAIARQKCGLGDVVKITSELPGTAQGADAAGIGRFRWKLSGEYTTDGRRWQFNGRATPLDDVYNFNKQEWGTRDFWAEVSTRLGASFPGQQFSVRIQGFVTVGISGVCSLGVAGDALV